MAKKTVALTTKRFGARYGRKTKLKVALIEAERRKKQKCPFCLKEKVRRLSMGIWHCGACHKKFAGKAYSVEKKITFEEEQ
ncbi:MAG TPA: 50S ribosomal protein L37ae [Candidatus Nanoarchaeia archaeon]|nr:50S ribosomal protein L37ae [Candidatus Nanoarchaeia archaeon]